MKKIKEDVFMKRHNIKKLLICTGVITLISTSQVLAKTSKELPVVISQKDRCGQK